MYDLKNYILNIFNNYPFTSKDSIKFAKNNLATSLRHGISDINTIDKIINGDLFSKGSPGKSRWSTVPWFAIFDRNITKTAQHGIYIVYLFSADGSKVYLSLNQGWTYFKNKYKHQKNAKIKAQNDIQGKSSQLRSMISYDGSKFNDVPINLESTGNLPIGYELGNILSVKYTKYDLPSNDILINDLINMIQIFNNLKSNLDFSGYTYKTNQNYNNYAKKLRNIAYKQHNIDNIHYRKTKPSKVKTSNNKTKRKHHLSKIDYKKSEDIKTSIGNYGENVVMKIEKDKLINANRKDLANNIEHVSITQGDGLGYDIQSFDIKGNKIYIEVKSTNEGYNAPFNISPNELDISNKMYFRNNPYIIYRLYNMNINSDKNMIDYYTIYCDAKHGILNDQLNLNPNSYSAILKR